MIKRININKKILLAIIVIGILLIGYYSYYKKSAVYKEFEDSSNLEELISYETNEEKTDNNLQQKSEQKEIAEDKQEENNEKIIVHITGEVKNWGVIELEKGSRVIDAVNIAGGFTADADIDKVNLAYILTDAIKIYIPSKNEDEENVTTSKEYITTDSGENIVMEEENTKKSGNSIININNATQTELETLPGIGPSIALK